MCVCHTEIGEPVHTNMESASYSQELRKSRILWPPAGFGAYSCVTAQHCDH